MTTSSTIEARGNRPWSHPRAQAIVQDHGLDDIVLTRAAGNSSEFVFVEQPHGDMLWLTREQAADFAEALHKVSGMATSTRGAQFLARAVREGLVSEGVSQARVCAVTGITRYRLRRILSGDLPMTHDEHVAISEVTP